MGEGDGGGEGEMEVGGMKGMEVGGKNGGGWDEGWVGE